MIFMMMGGGGGAADSEILIVFLTVLGKGLECICGASYYGACTKRTWKGLKRRYILVNLAIPGI